MKKIFLLAAGFVMVALLSTMVLAEQSGNAPVVQQQAGQPDQPADETATSGQSASGKTGLSKRNKAKIDLAEQRKLRQLEIEKERAADAQPK